MEAGMETEMETEMEVLSWRGGWRWNWSWRSRLMLKLEMGMEIQGCADPPLRLQGFRAPGLHGWAVFFLKTETQAN